MSIRTLILKAENEELSGPFEDKPMLTVSANTSNPLRLKGGQYAVRSSDVGANPTGLQIADLDDNWLALSDGIDTEDDSNVYNFARGTIIRHVVSVATPLSWISTVKRS